MVYDFDNDDEFDPEPSSYGRPADWQARMFNKRDGKVREGQVQRAIAYLREKGVPQTRAQICRDCNIPQGSYKQVFSDRRFVATVEGLVWCLTEEACRFGRPALQELDRAARPPAKVPPTTDSERVQVLRKALTKDQPQQLTELSRNTLIGQATIFRIFKENPSLFSREESLYWLAGKAKRESDTPYATGGRTVPNSRKPIMEDHSL